MFRPASWSLSVRASVVLLVVNLLAAALIVLQFYLSFWRSVIPEDDVEQLEPLKKLFRTYDAEDNPAIPPEMTALLSRYHLRFVAVDERGQVLAASEGVTGLFFTQSQPWFNESFRIPAVGDAPALYGFSTHKGAATLQVATPDPTLFYGGMMRRLSHHLAVICWGFLSITLVANALVLYWSLRPLRRASEDAAAIGPQTTSARLSERGLPPDVMPLVQAVNRCLDRLEQGYLAQRNFIADAAHELRTPLAVLKTHLEVLDDRDIAASLADDLGSMERLVSQLLALARLDGLQGGVSDPVDLAALAIDVARHMGPIAFEQSREIEVIGAEHPCLVAGSFDFLFRAVRNLVENALRHTPTGSVVTIRLAAEAQVISVEDQGSGVPSALRSLIFERFWRGDGDRLGDSGAGLGLAIVAATMRLHGGRVEIGDAVGGGAVFSLIFKGGA